MSVIPRPTPGPYGFVKNSKEKKNCMKLRFWAMRGGGQCIYLEIFQTFKHIREIVLRL